MPRGSKPKFSPEVEREIVERYQQNGSFRRLAAEFGCTPATIGAIVKRHGVKVNPRGNRYREFAQEEVSVMARLWEDGYSQHAIANRLGVSQSVVSRVLRAHGYQPRIRRAEGERHGNWTGGRTKTPHGYWQIKVPHDHPFASMRTRMGYVVEHRLNVAEALGRPLSADETVHHINSDREDNRLDNLQLRRGRHGNGVVMRCAECGSTHIVTEELAERSPG